VLEAYFDVALTVAWVYYKTKTCVTYFLNSDLFVTVSCIFSGWDLLTKVLVKATISSYWNSMSLPSNS